MLNIFLFIFINIFLKTFLIIIPILLAVAFLTLLERKVMASMQQRRGPNIVGFFGLLQPFADGLKLLIKETVIPSSANVFIFIFAPVFSFFLSLITWSIIPFASNGVFLDFKLGVLIFFAVSSMGVYGIVLAGWSSNSKYSFLGGLRSAAQMISYEISIGLLIMPVLICSNSLNLSLIIDSQSDIYFFFPLFPIFIMFFISGLAETNRAPFDLPEAEAELVSGFNTEYSAMNFALFFLGEYSNIILICCFLNIFFLGGWLPIFNFFNFFSESFWFGLKTTFLLFVFIWVRASFPRFRYDQLMRLGWKIFLPFSLGWFFFISGFLFGFDFLC